MRDPADAPEWGRHICQLYKTSEDLLAFQVPFFVEGVRRQEAGLWLINPPLTCDHAAASLRREGADLDTYLWTRQLELREASEHYRGSTIFDPKSAAGFWSEHEASIRRRGFRGLRISGNIHQRFALPEWKLIMEYERQTDLLLHERRMTSLCCYSEEMLGAGEIADVVSAHQSCIVHREGQWEIIANHEYRRAEAQSERFFSVAQDMLGIASMRDGSWLAINSSMERTLGFTAAELPPLPLLPLVHEVDCARSKEAAARLFSGESAEGFEQRLRCRNNVFRSISWKIFTDREDMIIYCSGRDITGERESQHRLRELAAQREQLLASEHEAREEAERLNSIKDLYDAWGTPMRYSVDGGGRSYRLSSLGSDRREGGSGVETDITITGP